MRILSVRNIPNEKAKKAYNQLRNRSILSKITKDGITTLEIIVPENMPDDHILEILKNIIKYDENNWQYKHTNFNFF